MVLWPTSCPGQTKSNQQNGHCIRRCSKRPVKSGSPHVDLFATHLNHKVPLYVSPIPDQHAWDVDALNIDWSDLTVYAYPPTALLYMVIKIQANPLLRQYYNPRLAKDALVLVRSEDLSGDPTPITSVNNTSQTIPQPSVSQQSVSQFLCLVSRSGQLQ